MRAVRGSGEIDCWGNNDYDETNTPPGRHRSVSAGSSYTCAAAVNGGGDPPSHARRTRA